MARPVDRESRIGRRLKLRDLHIFFAVDQHGSMARAAAKLGMSQPSVSEVVANMEGTLGVKLLDRSPKGVETTQYGRALLRRARAAFDELNQAVRDIEFLADPTVGEVRMGCPESIAAAFLPVVIRDFVRDYPGIALHIDQMATPTLELPELRARKIDFVIARLNKSLAEDPFGDDLSVEILFDDEIVVAAGIHSRWTRRRKLGLAELADAQWIQTSTDSWGALLIEEMFRAGGLEKPRTSVTTFSVHLRTNLTAMGDLVTIMPRSVLNLNAERFGLCTLPVQLSPRPWPVALVTLKNRTLSPPAALFLERLRQSVRSTVAPHPSNAKPPLTLQRNRRDGRTNP